MARIRTVKPEFWQHPKVTRVSRDARLLFLGLLNEADDKGKMRYASKRLAGVLFGDDDDVTATEVDAWVDELEDARLVQRYEVDEASYLIVPGFTEHQKINRPSPSKLPDPSWFVTEGSSRDQGAMDDGTGEGEASSGRRATRIPEEFDVTPEMVVWVERECPSVNWRHHSQRFVNYWKAASGRNAVKHDWPRTWQNWMLKEQGA